MNTPEQEIEDTLRRAPAPKAPAGLKDRLAAQIQLAPVRAKAPTSAQALHPRSWLGRWWPALAPAAVSLACAMVVTVQQTEICDLKQTLEALSQGATAQAPVPAQGAVQPAALGGPSETQQQEIARLQDLARRLAGEIAQLEQLRAENEKLRARVAAAAASGLTPEEEAALAEAREKAALARCCNNLKQLGISVKVWALDNDQLLPPDILCMSNEIASPITLICPSDTGRQAAAGWSAYNSANCSYEYLGGSGGRSDEEPDRVLFRCPIHGSIGLADSSVQMSVAKKHPEDLVWKDGKLYDKPHDALPEGKVPGAPSQESSPDPSR